VELYTIAPTPSANEEQRPHIAAAQALHSAILDVLWDPSKLAFYDFNIAAKARNGIYTAATFYPLWCGIIPDELLTGQDQTFGFFSTVNMVMNRYNGTYPTTFVETGLQWYVASFSYLS
jgi:alpha,alpha-trehalase